MSVEIRNTVAVPVDIPIPNGTRKSGTTFLFLALVLMFIGIFLLGICFTVEDPAKHWNGPISENKAKEFRIERAENKQFVTKCIFVGCSCIVCAIPFIILRIKAPYVTVYQIVEGYEFTEP